MTKLIIWGTGREAQRFTNLIDYDNNIIVAVIKEDNTIDSLYDCGEVPVIQASEIAGFEYDYVCICVEDYERVINYCKNNSIHNYINGNISAFFLMGNKNAGVEIERRLNKIQRVVSENSWANVFHDTTVNLEWYKPVSLSLGRWAVGYLYAYLLVRILDSLRPDKILECGLGQSTKILNNYIDYYKDTYADVIDDNKEWVDFFSKSFDFNERVHISISRIAFTCFKGNKCSYYRDFKKLIGNKKYKLFLIDGPIGGADISRIDVLEHIPLILDNEFVIIIDDYNRCGEQTMVNLLKEKLASHAIEFASRCYSGEKDVAMVVSKKYEFFLSM